MPRLVEAATDDAIGLADLVDLIETGDFDPRDEDNFASWGPALKKLANNRTFLADLVIEELKNRCRGQTRDNQYSPQVIMLHGPSKNFALRANFWPAMTDSILRSSGTEPFFYGVPHDHNFSFLTVGYLGPGYWSEYYEFDYDRVVGHAGEAVDLRFVEKAKLDEGKVLLYRAHKDVHNQLAADSMSISINIMAVDRTTPFRDQYKFDVTSGRVDTLVNRIAMEPLLAVSAHFGGEEGADLLDSFADRHPSDRVRFLAIQAQAATAGDLDARIAHYQRAATSENPYISRMAQLEAEKLERGRAWIEAPPLAPAA